VGEECPEERGREERAPTDVDGRRPPMWTARANRFALGPPTRADRPQPWTLSANRTGRAGRGLGGRPQLTTTHDHGPRLGAPIGLLPLLAALVPALPGFGMLQAHTPTSRPHSTHSIAETSPHSSHTRPKRRDSQSTVVSRRQVSQDPRSPAPTAQLGHRSSPARFTSWTPSTLPSASAQLPSKSRTHEQSQPTSHPADELPRPREPETAQPGPAHELPRTPGGPGSTPQDHFRRHPRTHSCAPYAW